MYNNNATLRGYILWPKSNETGTQQQEKNSETHKYIEIQKKTPT